MRQSRSRKRLICRVRPGVRDTRAKFVRFISALIRLDLPTFERPTNATSGSKDAGNASMVAAPATNSQEPANSFRANSGDMPSLTRRGIRFRAGEPTQRRELQIVEQMNLCPFAPHDHILLQH